MPNSRNIKTMSDEIQHLKDEVHNLDVEIPTHTSGDSGKYLGVDSSGDLAFSNVPNELPPTTGATAGQILALDNDKAPEWVNNYNLNYSETEHLTGQKCIDGKDVYMITFSGNTPDSETNYISLNLTYDTIISFCGVYLFSNQNYRDLNRVFQVSSINAKTALYLYKGPDSTTYNIPFTLTVFYTKPTLSALTSGDPNREALEETRELIEEPEQAEEPVTKKSTRKSTK